MGYMGLLGIFLNFRIVFNAVVLRLRYVKYRFYISVTAKDTFSKGQGIKRNIE